MSCDQHICSVENVQQTVTFVYQHITGARTHKEFDAAYPMLVQLAELCVIIIGGTEVAGMVDNTLLIQKIEFLFKCIERGSQWLCVRHVHDGSDTTGSSCTAFGKDVRFMGQSRITEMYMVVNDTRKQTAAGGIYCFITRGGQFFAISQYLGNLSVFNYYGTLHRTSLVNYCSVMYQSSFHSSANHLSLITNRFSQLSGTCGTSYVLSI